MCLSEYSFDSCSELSYFTSLKLKFKFLNNATLWVDTNMPPSCFVVFNWVHLLCFSLSLTNSGLHREEAPVLINSNVQLPHPHPTHTQGPSSLSLHSPLQPSPWFSQCPPQQPCHSTQQLHHHHSSLPLSLNAIHGFCAWLCAMNATMLPQQLPSLPAVEVKFLTLNKVHKRRSFRGSRGKRNKSALVMVAASQIHMWR